MNAFATFPNFFDSLAYHSLNLCEGEYRIRFLKEHGINVEVSAEYYAAIPRETWEQIRIFFEYIAENCKEAA